MAEQETDYSGRPLETPKAPRFKGGKLIPQYPVVFDLPDGRKAAMFGDYEAYVLDDDGAFDFEQPAEIPESIRLPPGL